jgi:hypothetical protein
MGKGTASHMHLLHTPNMGPAYVLMAMKTCHHACSCGLGTPAGAKPVQRQHRALGRVWGGLPYPALPCLATTTATAPDIPPGRFCICEHAEFSISQHANPNTPHQPYRRNTNLQRSMAGMARMRWEHRTLFNKNKNQGRNHQR